MRRKQIQALFLAVIMIFSVTTNMAPVFADDLDQDSSLFPHEIKDSDCSYCEGSDRSLCEHVHDADCGYAEAKEEIACDKDCSTDTDGDGIIDHAADCAYRPAVEGHECMHVHNEECGYQTPLEPLPNDCICTSLCEDGSSNEDCPVCSEDHTNCAYTTVDVSLTFNLDYAHFGASGGALLNVAGNISGKKVTKAQIDVLLSDEEIAMLNVSDLSDISINDNRMVFTLVNDEDTGIVSINWQIPVQADSLSSLDIAKEDIEVSVFPDEYQTVLM